MDIFSNVYGCFLMPIMIQKLLDEFRIAFSWNLESEMWELKDISREFHKELQLTEQCLVNSKDLKISGPQARDKEVSHPFYFHFVLWHC